MANNPGARFSEIRKILIQILILNWAVALAKIAYGLISRFSSMTADGFHSLADGLSNIIGLIGIYIAAQPKDKNHPYGHKKYETLFSLIIAALLAFICINLIKSGVIRLYKPTTPEINLISFIVIITTMIINFWVMNYEYNKGKVLQSDILISDSQHTKSDIFISFSVIVALLVTKLGFPIIDPIVTIIISLFIGYSAFEILKQGSNVLCDATPILDEKQIINLVLSIRGVESCHKVRCRGREDDIYIDLHVQVNPNTHVDQAHQISNQIERTLKKNIAGVTDVVVHIEPK